MLISLFIACYNDTLFPETGKAVVAVLERLGHTVEFPEDQTCCGQMHYNTGYAADALPLMRHFVRVFAGAEVICVPSASCVAMMREHYPKMAAETGEAELVEAVRTLLPRVFEFTELLVDKLGVTDVGASTRTRSRSTRPAIRCARCSSVTARRRCCARCAGSSCSTCRTATSAAASAARSRSRTRTCRRRWRPTRSTAVIGTGAEVCTAADNSCLMQIGGVLARTGSDVRCVHIAEILASTGEVAT